MATDYLEKYIESVSDLPAQLQRKFRLIRDLDEKSAKLQVCVVAGAPGIATGHLSCRCIDLLKNAVHRSAHAAQHS